MPVRLSDSGSWKKTEDWLRKMQQGELYATLDKYGAMGVAALSAATPVDDGETAQSWSYEIKKSRGSYSIAWKNSKMAGGTPLVILLQYGHGTGTGGYVQGRDFINPAIKPIFDQIDAEVRKVVSR